MEKLPKNIPAYPNPETREILVQILTGPTSVSHDGYPYLCESSFALFLKTFSHLFEQGHQLLEWLNATQPEVKNSPSIVRAIEVLKTVIRTANITAPPDLWVLRYILSTYQKMKILPFLMKQREFAVEDLVKKFTLNERQLRIDFDLLHCRGYLEKINKDNYQISEHPQTLEVLKIPVLPEIFHEKWVEILEKFLRNLEPSQGQILIEKFLELGDEKTNHTGWIADRFDIEYGFRLLPIVLAFRKLENNDLQLIPKSPSCILDFLKHGGMVNQMAEVTPLGERVFSRGPGPFGIIYAYLEYMHQHEQLLLGNPKGVWVARGENVTASQEANRKTFHLINKSLDHFCKQFHFQFNVFIEHAVGYGEATRQRFLKDGEKTIQYFGADLEDAAIDRAREAQKMGQLPANMQFIRNADIGTPSTLINGIKKAGFEVKNAVMVVGNGFHEVRNQTNEKMIEIFRAYCHAKILLIFTEESALTNEDLLATGWNTYHAGFRYVHALSGQGLRPVYDLDVAHEENPIFSWEKCVTLGGYKLLKEFTTRTRTIYPHPRANHRNPAISINYFCVPPDFVPGMFLAFSKKGNKLPS